MQESKDFATMFCARVHGGHVGLLCRDVHCWILVPQYVDRADALREMKQHSCLFCDAQMLAFLASARFKTRRIDFTKAVMSDPHPVLSNLHTITHMMLGRLAVIR